MSETPKWIDNVSAFAEVMPLGLAAMTLSLGSMEWPSAEGRDEFIDVLARGGVTDFGPE